MAESVNSGSSASSSTVVLNEAEESAAPMPSVRLKLKKPKTQKKKVAWTPETIDNEHMNKKKSKCCCIYEKPKEFDESSSDTDDECEHCQGHVEKKPKDQTPAYGDQTPSLPDQNDSK